MELDAKDLKILSLLQNDATYTNKYIGLQVDLSTSAVQLRRQTLEEMGVIKNYAAILDKELLHCNFVVFCSVSLLQHRKSYIEAFEKTITSFNEVVDCYHCSGEHDYILKIVVKDMEAYRDFLVTKLTAIEYIGNTHSSFVISELKESFSLPINNNN